MTTFVNQPGPRTAGAACALRAVSTAGERLTAAKRTKSLALIASAEGDLQRAVDAARDLEVGWGQIGSALGIARGNAYQRYRTKPSQHGLRVPADSFRYPPL